MLKAFFCRHQYVYRVICYFKEFGFNEARCQKCGKRLAIRSLGSK